MSSNATTTVRLLARLYEDEDDCLVAAAEDVLADYRDIVIDLSGYDLSPRWADDRNRQWILVDVPVWAVRAKEAKKKP